MLKASEKSKLNLVWYNPRRSRDTESGSLAGARPGPPPHHGIGCSLPQALGSSS